MKIKIVSHSSKVIPQYVKIKAFLSLIKHHAINSRYLHEKIDTDQDYYFTGNEEEILNI